MATVHPLRNFFFVTFNLCTFFVLSGCQTTPFDEYGQVSVPNQEPSIPTETDKTYTTTIRLEKISESVQFVATSFTSAAAGFYASALVGFIVVENVESSDISTTITQVTYDVRYNYANLLGSVNGDDTVIQNAIGNLEAVRKGLNEQPNILSFYTVLLDEQSIAQFSFGGSAICGFATCVGTYVSCIESTNGVNATCVSECKAGYCGDNGICFHSDANEVPTCRCTSLPDLWIIGERCETKFPLWLVVLLAVIGFLIILLVIIIVLVCVIKRRKEQRRKQELLNSVPATYQNKAFANDEIRTNNIVPQTTIVPTPRNPALSSLARDDSFETVTSSEMPPSEYRPRTQPGRRSHASSIANSNRNHHHYHHHNGDRHHYQHHRRHRRRSSSDESDRSRRRERDRSRERSEPQRKSLPSDTSSSESEVDQKDPKNLSFYEVEVNDLDLETDAESSVAAANSTKSSPIRWLPPKDGQPRPGWVPSLGPMMYDLPTSKKTNTTGSESLPRRREGGTDV